MIRILLCKFKDSHLTFITCNIIHVITTSRTDCTAINDCLFLQFVQRIYHVSNMECDTGRNTFVYAAELDCSCCTNVIKINMDVFMRCIVSTTGLVWKLCMSLQWIIFWVFLFFIGDIMILVTDLMGALERYSFYLSIKMLLGTLILSKIFQSSGGRKIDIGFPTPVVCSLPKLFQ
jgi:hypothetical protein